MSVIKQSRIYRNSSDSNYLRTMAISCEVMFRYFVHPKMSALWMTFSRLRGSEPTPKFLKKPTPSESHVIDKVSNLPRSFGCESKVRRAMQIDWLTCDSWREICTLLSFCAAIVACHSILKVNLQNYKALIKLDYTLKVISTLSSARPACFYNAAVHKGVRNREDDTIKLRVDYSNQNLWWEGYFASRERRMRSSRNFSLLQSVIGILTKWPLA